jgi:hypothetical protein
VVEQLHEQWLDNGWTMVGQLWDNGLPMAKIVGKWLDSDLTMFEEW